MGKKQLYEINIDTTRLMSDLQSVKLNLDSIQTWYTRMDKVYEGVKESWSGEAADAFVSSFDVCLHNICNVHDSLLGDVEELIMRCKEFSDCEQSVITKVKGMGWSGE